MTLILINPVAVTRLSKSRKFFKKFCSALNIRATCTTLQTIFKSITVASYIPIKATCRNAETSKLITAIPYIRFI